MADVIPDRGKVLLGLSSTSRGPTGMPRRCRVAHHRTIARSLAARRRWWATADLAGAHRPIGGALDPKADGAAHLAELL